MLRDRNNPMEVYGNGEFRAWYRFTKPAGLQLLEMLPLEANTDDRGCPVPPLLQVLVTLRFYGAGTFQVVSGDLVNISQPTVLQIVERVTTMIAARLFPALVKLPDCTKVPQVIQEFYRMGQFPGVTGCLDCTHVRIKSPGGNDAKVFRNRKGYFSINVQAITGPQLQFFYVCREEVQHLTEEDTKQRREGVWDLEKVLSMPGYETPDKDFHFCARDNSMCRPPQLEPALSGSNPSRCPAFQHHTAFSCRSSCWNSGGICTATAAAAGHI
ncbi:hypothetical protein V5799_010155 [Amblyomma americanum]|uniref:Nuclease harbi1-like protein n=1 Tax=Amblyomma americanum TaxID=6943 RepID=A0AAQ4F8G2_AMBAM